MKGTSSVALLVCLGAIAGGLKAAEDVSFYQVAKLLASDGRVGDAFGSSVGLSGETAVVGAVQDDSTGSAYVFQRDARRPHRWRQVAKLTADDPFFVDLFGTSVAVSGDTAVVGAPGDDDLGADSGSAYVYRHGPGGAEDWRRVAKLTATDGAALDFFGTSVAISADIVVVGAEGNDDLGTYSGSAYVFRPGAGSPGSWEQVAKLSASDGGAYDQFGTSVAISGDTAVVGARGDDSANVFRRDAGGGESWGEIAKLTPADDGLISYFGWSVSLSGDTAVVSEIGSPEGSAFVFRRDAGGPDQWGQVARLTAADGRDRHEFGTSVAVSGDTAVVGAIGDEDLGEDYRAAYVFRLQRDPGGTDAWRQVAKLTAPPGGDFGASVAIDGETAVVGADQEGQYLEESTGSAHIFRETLVDPSLSVSGVCPGEVTLTGSRFTPRGLVALYGAFEEGSSVIDRGPCVGTPLGLEEAEVFDVQRADAAGRSFLRRDTSGDDCGRLLQAVDLTSCAVSDAVRIP